jgi:Lecithin:cholesterol acyltransferase
MLSHMEASVISPPSAYDRMRLDDAQLCALLASGRSRRALQAVFGRPDYQTLALLAQRAARARPRHPAPVYLLPGIMGTQLGLARAAPEVADLLWIDPQDIIAGQLRLMRLHTAATPGDAAGLITLGAIPYTYLALQLRLQAAGYRVLVHPYDWRRSLAVLASEFAARVRADSAAQVMIVAHSMGGLLARASLALPGMGKVQRMISLGVPQRGSYGALQALRGTYPVVQRLAALDRQHDAETLATEVFGSFPSLYELLPPAGHGGPDLHGKENWPLAGPRPSPELLQAARSFISTLPASDERHCAIVGLGQRTVTGVRSNREDFLYQVSSAGDGTVAFDSARLEGRANYQLRCEHSALPRSATVARAIAQLLATGHTRSLRPVTASDVTQQRQPAAITVSDRELRSNWSGKIDWSHCTPPERREYLNRLNQAPPQYALRRARPRR